MTTGYDIARFASAGVFGLLGVQGLWGAAEQFNTSDTTGKIIQTFALVAYGSSGMSIAFRVILRKSRLLPLEVVWSAGIILAAGLAPSVWGGAPPIASMMSAVGGGAIVALTLWMHKTHQSGSGAEGKDAP